MPVVCRRQRQGARRHPQGGQQNARRGGQQQGGADGAYVCKIRFLTFGTTESDFTMGKRKDAGGKTGFAFITADVTHLKNFSANGRV